MSATTRVAEYTRKIKEATMSDRHPHFWSSYDPSDLDDHTAFSSNACGPAECLLSVVVVSKHDDDCEGGEDGLTTGHACSPQLHQGEPPTDSRSLMRNRPIRPTRQRISYNNSHARYALLTPHLMDTERNAYLTRQRFIPVDKFFEIPKKPFLSTLRSYFVRGQIPNSPKFWLFLYFSANLTLTLYNKLVLVHFPLPYSLSALHALCGTLGGTVLLTTRTFNPARLAMQSTPTIAAFSALYAGNIAVSNVSLQLVTIPFHQVVRAATPIFTIAISIILFGTHDRTGCSRAKVMSLLPVVFGVGLATYGDYYFTYGGLLLTLLGAVLAAFKTIFTNILQSPQPAYTSKSAQKLISASPYPIYLHLHPVDLLIRTSPLAFLQCLFLAYTSGELERLKWHIGTDLTLSHAGWLLGNGVLACGLNVVSFSANKKAGPVGMTVAANVKQVLTILLSVVIFDLTITQTNALGIGLTLAGGAWYAWVEQREKSKPRFLRRG